MTPTRIASSRKLAPHRLVVATTSVLALVATAIAAAPTIVSAAEDPALDQTVDADEATVEGQAVIDAGHVDLGPRFVDGIWQLQARDDRQQPPVWRQPDHVVLQVTDAAVLAAPDGDDYSFLDAVPGDPVHVIPQTQDPEVVWLGWNTQDPEVVERIDGGATLAIHDVEGPGELSLFLQEGVTEGPNVLWDSTEPFPQDLFMEVNTHTHANWVFTEPGVYRVAVEVQADLVDGDDPASSLATLRFAVGEELDPQSAFDLPDLTAAASSDESPSPAAAADDPPESDGSFDTILVLVAVGVLLLVGVVAVLAITSRRTRARADTDGPA